MPSFPDTVLTDYQIFDGNEVLTLTPEGLAAIANITGSVYSPDRKSIGTSPAGSQVEIRVTDRWIDLFVNTITGDVEVGPGDRITRSDNSIWWVISASKKTFETRWHCLCRKQPNS